MAHTQASSSYHDSDDDLPTLDVLLARLPGRTTQKQPLRPKTALYPDLRKTILIDLEEDDDVAEDRTNKNTDSLLSLSDTVRGKSIPSSAKEGIQEKWWPSRKKPGVDVDGQEEDISQPRRRIIHGEESRPRIRTTENSGSNIRSIKEPQIPTRHTRRPSEMVGDASTSSASTSSDTSLRSRQSQLLTTEQSDSSDQEEPTTQHPRHKERRDIARPFSRLQLDQQDLLREHDSQPGDPTPSLHIPSPKKSKQTRPALPKGKAHGADTGRHLESDDEWDEPPVVSETNPGRLTASKTTSAKKQTKKSFEAKKSQLATDFLGQLDTRITHGKIGELTESTGGVKIVWSNTLKTTAGRANWKREAVMSRQTSDSDSDGAGAKQYRHHTSIELSEKVIDDEQRLLNVIAHEFCHLANFMINGITDNPHGKEFKVWAAKCSQMFASQGIKVTTKHTYEIDFKYVWACTACGCEYKRHSKSIDPTRHRCGACKAVLEQTKPTPRQTPSTGQQLSGYQLFVKEQMKIVRSENPNSPQKEIMSIVAEKWAKAKS